MNSNQTLDITPELLAENPTLALCLTAFSLFLFVGFTGALVSWALVVTSWWRGKTLLPVANWSPRPWGLADFVVAAILVVVAQILFSSVAIQLFDINVEALRGENLIPMPIAAAVGASHILAVALVTGWIVFRYNAHPAVLGWSVQRMPQLLMTGLVAGLVTLPLVFAISAAVSIGMQTEYEHPILESIQKDGTLGTYLLAFFAAVIAAPIAEEFLFRVLLQGWLQSIPYNSVVEIVLGKIFDTSSKQPTAAASLNGLPPTVTAAEMSSGAASATAVESEAPVERQSSESSQAATDPSDNSRPAPVWPSFVSGTLFGLAHWEYGLSFIPLIVLGIILGLLYRATISIWPSIMVHFMLNISSMFAMGVGVYLERVAGGPG